MRRKKAAAPKSPVTVRLCANIRSRKHPDLRCPLAASQGEFCARHYKHPVRFQEKIALASTISLKELAAAAQIQKFWRTRAAQNRFRRQGPITNTPDEAENKTDLFTMDPTNTIPLLYRWSYQDPKRHFWIFDVRSLNMTMSQDQEGALNNPYTREPFPEAAKAHFQNRCTWLRERKYCLLHSNEQELSPEQLWHQRLLDVTMKYDILGYHMALHWFEELTFERLVALYLELWELWFFRLDLSQQVKSEIVPGWNDIQNPLFRLAPRDLRTRRHEIQWWKKLVLDLLERLATAAPTKEHRGLGALYGMTGFAFVSGRVRQFYPWLVQMD